MQDNEVQDPAEPYRVDETVETHTEVTPQAPETEVVKETVTETPVPQPEPEIVKETVTETVTPGE